MKLRLAKKIAKSLIDENGEPQETPYTERQKTLALNRIDRTKSAKRDTAYWNAMMEYLGPVGRSQLVKKWDAGAAFKLLMTEPWGPPEEPRPTTKEQ